MRVLVLIMGIGLVAALPLDEKPNPDQVKPDEQQKEPLTLMGQIPQGHATEPGYAYPGLQQPELEARAMAGQPIAPANIPLGFNQPPAGHGLGGSPPPAPGQPFTGPGFTGNVPPLGQPIVDHEVISSMPIGQPFMGPGLVANTKMGQQPFVGPEVPLSAGNVMPTSKGKDLAGNAMPVGTVATVDKEKEGVAKPAAATSLPAKADKDKDADAKMEAKAAPKEKTDEQEQPAPLPTDGQEQQFGGIPLQILGPCPVGPNGEFIGDDQMAMGPLNIPPWQHPMQPHHPFSQVMGWTVPYPGKFMPPQQQPTNQLAGRAQVPPPTVVPPKAAPAPPPAPPTAPAPLAPLKPGLVYQQGPYQLVNYQNVPYLQATKYFVKDVLSGVGGLIPVLGSPGPVGYNVPYATTYKYNYKYPAQAAYQTSYGPTVVGHKYGPSYGSGWANAYGSGSGYGPVITTVYDSNLQLPAGGVAGPQQVLAPQLG